MSWRAELGLMFCLCLALASCQPADPLLLAGGDVLLGRHYETGNLPARPLGPLTEFLPIGDHHPAVLVNLEGPLLAADQQAKPPPDKPAEYTFAAPVAAAQLLTDLGVTVVSGANNHFMDAGRPGLVTTRAALMARSIAVAGAGDNLGQALEPIKLTSGASPVVVLAFQADFPGTVPAAEYQPGTAAPTPDQMIEAVRQARSRQPGAFLAVSLHWGVELSPIPDQEQVNLARSLLRAGADVLIGHHPHVLQGVLREGKGLAFFSLGNLVFDQTAESTSQTVVIALQRDPTGRTTALVRPLVIDRVSHLPQLADAASADQILDRLAALSRPLGVKLVQQAGLAKIE